MHVAPDCTSMSIIQNLNECTRTMDMPQGDGTLASEVRGNELAALPLWFFWGCLRYGVCASLEHPLSSRLWQLPLAKHILALEGIVAVDLDQCAWGKRPADWDPSQGT